MINISYHKTAYVEVDDLDVFTELKECLSWAYGDTTACVTMQSLKDTLIDNAKELLEYNPETQLLNFLYELVNILETDDFDGDIIFEV